MKGSDMVEVRRTGEADPLELEVVIREPKNGRARPSGSPPASTRQNAVSRGLQLTRTESSTLSVMLPVWSLKVPLAARASAWK